MNKIFELATGSGKSKLALDCLDFTKKNLIVIPKLCLIDNWNAEIKKWHYSNENIVYSTYVSLHKQVDNQYDTIIYDECHHLSERCRDFMGYIKSNNNLFLSATIPRDIKSHIFNSYENVVIDKKDLREQIEDNKLPEPDVYLIKLTLDNKNRIHKIEKKYKGKKVVKVFTQQEYYDDIEKDITWYKDQVMYMGKSIYKNIWMQKCLARNKQLSRFKEYYTKKLLEKFKYERVLTFCCDIKQAENLGNNDITSKNKNALKVLDNFNRGLINHITTVNVLSEGVNLAKCKYGVFNYINSSNLLIVQKIGRILRDSHPVLIVPYFENTREQELVEKIIEPFSKEKIITVNQKDLL